MVATNDERMTFDELEQRADRAAEYCHNAIAGRDWSKLERAFARLVERWGQWDALHRAELVDEFGADGGVWEALQYKELLPQLQNREITAGDLLRAAGQADAPVLVIASIDARWFGLVQRIERGEQLSSDALAFARERIASGYSEELAATIFGEE